MARCPLSAWKKCNVIQLCWNSRETTNVSSKGSHWSTMRRACDEIFGTFELQAAPQVHGEKYRAGQKLKTKYIYTQNVLQVDQHVMLQLRKLMWFSPCARNTMLSFKFDVWLTLGADCRNGGQVFKQNPHLRRHRVKIIWSFLAKLFAHTAICIYCSVWGWRDANNYIAVMFPQKVVVNDTKATCEFTYSNSLKGVITLNLYSTTNVAFKVAMLLKTILLTHEHVSAHRGSFTLIRSCLNIASPIHQEKGPEEMIWHYCKRWQLASWFTYEWHARLF